MSWRYVAARRIKGDEEVWDIREYYTELDVDGKGPGTSWTIEPMAAHGDSLDSLRLDLMRMLKDTMDPREFLDLDREPPGLEELP